ncbi:hypothetical protein [Azospirillum lipoferum]|uniref:Pyridoxamine 5'-phosphate oxidase putative domain-containing protein n=1 Tax=Azospirillum lipoferum (strain 4B) TaxID=862719 RepID=G7ZFD5_AZOL4|nr:hypothetical protein [Azospirillum lipoferum]CBS90218.1 conserved protein of unknown function [Azospirillum lipoferum 4B]
MAEPDGLQLGTGVGAAVLRFLDRSLSVNVATSDRANRPLVARAVAARASCGGERLTVLLDGRANAELVAAVADTGRLAVVFSEPSTHRSLQVKGDGAVVTAPTAEEAALAGPYLDGFIAELTGIGFTEPFIRAVMTCDPVDLVALHVRPATVFDQTPGPKAGEPVPA